jgi:broad specificity phosphatase PhoE
MKAKICLTLTLMLFSAITLSADIYLVRHFEKQVSTKVTGSDVSLTELGQLQAQALAKLLLDRNITQIYSTDYKRTKQSASPIAKALNITIQTYNPNELAAFAEHLNSLESNILVLGHSNTTPELFALLKCYDVILNDGDYGDVFKVALNANNEQMQPNCSQELISL